MVNYYKLVNYYSQRRKNVEDEYDLPKDKELLKLKVGSQVQISILIGRYVRNEDIWCEVTEIEITKVRAVKITMKVKLLEQPILAKINKGDIIVAAKENILNTK